MDGAPGKRQIYSGSPKALEAIFRRHATSLDFVVYEEDLNAKKDTDKIFQSAGLWRELLALQPNGAFTKKHVEGALAAVAVSNFGETLQQDTVRKDWTSRLSLRIRAQGRAIGQALLKGNAKW
eukprot:12750146-Alexandrium_andersonii.AAC.1